MSKLKAWFKSELPSQKYNGMFGMSFLDGFTLDYPANNKRNKIPTAGITATVHNGDNVGTYVSAKRVIAGGVLFGPLGAGVGALIRKNHNQVHIVLEVEGQIIGTISGSAKHTDKAHQFAAKVNASASDPANT